jgi:hypothetical protein
MARVETIVVGGGISGVPPFDVNGIPYVVNTDPPAISTADWLTVVSPTSATLRALVVAAAGNPDPGATDTILRVKGGIFTEHATYTGSVVVGQDHSVTGTYPNGFVFFGRNLTVSSAAGTNALEPVLVGADISCIASGSNNTGIVIIGNNHSITATTIQSMVVIGGAFTQASGGGGVSVAIGTTLTYSANGGGVMIGNGTSITGGSSTLCTVVGDNASSGGSSSTCVGSSATSGGTAQANVCIGASASSNVSNCTIIGTGCVNTHANVIMLGRGLISFQSETAMIGSTTAAGQTSTLLVGGGNTVNGAGVGLTFRMTDCTNGGSDRVGGSMTIQSGGGTGAGVGSSIILQTPTTVASGTTVQAKATRLTVNELGGTFTVPVVHPAGAVGTPSIRFTDADTGLFEQAAGNVAVAAQGKEVARFTDTAVATETSLMLYDLDNNTLERVTVGAADSGGLGFKVLRIPN